MAITLKNNTPHNLDWMTAKAIAHRGLHDATKGIYENTLSAAQAAMDAGYNIELDLQPSLEMTPMVFHDYQLDRLTGHNGETRKTKASDLAALKVHQGKDLIPTLEDFLNLVDAKTGLVIELKGEKGADQNFVDEIIKLLSDYKGDFCLMSFDHHLLDEIHSLAPHMPLGLTAEGDDSHYEAHREIAERCNVDFISYYVKELNCRFVRDFKKTDRPIISWTVRSAEEKAHSDKFADQVTFEGFKP